MSLAAVTVFCDDIRFEQQGKITLVGVYGPDMFIYADYPIALPKLGVFVQMRMPPSEVKSGDLSILVYAPGNDTPLLTTVLQIPSPIEIKDEETSDLERIWTTNVPITISPLILLEDGYIKVRVSYNHNTYKAGALHVARTDQPDQNTISSEVS